MLLCRSLDSVKAAFVVWAQDTDSKTSFFLGSSRTAPDNTDGRFTGFYRQSKSIIENNGVSEHIRTGGTAFTNGVQVSYMTVAQVTVGEFSLTEIYPGNAAHVSALCTWNNDNTRFYGGAKIAEIILYERDLSDREKVSTRNYLMKKWFNHEPSALPAETAAASIGGAVALSNGYVWNLSAPANPSALAEGGIGVAGALSFGEGMVLNVTGVAEALAAGCRRMKIAEASSFSGIANLSDATISFSPSDPRFRPVFAVRDGVLWLNYASNGMCVTIK